MKCLLPNGRAHATAAVAMGRAAALALPAFLLDLGACTHAPAQPTIAEPVAAGIEIDEVGGHELVVLPFASQGLVRVALFIDAGSRDAQPPQIATLAAELAAAAGGPEIAHWTSPDAIELSVEGEASELPALFDQLGRALAFREVSAGALSHRVTELEARRRRAAADPLRTATALSIRAVLGETAESLFPLGTNEGDEAVTAAAAAAFLAQHFGADRTLAVIAGDVTREAAREVWAKSSRGWPAARASRSERAPIEERFAVEIRVDASQTFAVTALLPSVEAAAAACALIEESAAFRSSGASALAYPLRGGALLTVSAGRDADARTEQALLRIVLRAIDATEPMDGRARPRDPDERARRAPSTLRDVEGAARQIGLRWAAEGGERASAISMGIGAVVDGGRGDHATGDDRDAEVAERSAAALTAMLRSARDATRPALEPDRRDPSWRVLANGGRLRVAAGAPGSMLGLAIAFAGGLSEEPPDVQGRTKLIATALATRCGHEAGNDVRVRGFAEAEAFGIWVEAASARWARTAQRILDCVLVSPLDARSLEDARIAMLQRLVDEPDWPLFAAVSRALAPAAPGLIWPLGRPDSLDRVRDASVSEALARARVGKRVRITALGPVPSETVLRFLASAVARLAPGKEAPRVLPGAPLAGPIALETEGSPFVAAALRLSAGSATSARAYAEAYSEALRTQGIPVTSAAGGGGAWGRWVAVRVDGSPADLPALAERLRATRPTAARYAAELREHSRARRWAAAAPGSFAALSVLGELPPGDPSSDASLPPESQRPVFLVGRDQSGKAMERLRDQR